MGKDFSDAQAAREVDLFGNPVPQRRGKGRPAHVPTAETRAFVNMLFVCGHDVMAVARAVGVTKATFYKHYRPEIDARKQAALKFSGHQMMRLNRLAEQGNVAAEKALAGMIQAERVRSTGDRVAGRKVSSSASAPKGVKALREEAAAKVEGRFAARPAPPSAMVN